MHTIILTDLPARECRSETFRDGMFRVLSRSGLHPTECALLAGLPPPAAGHILVTGNRSGAMGLVLAAENPASEVVQHVFDLHHARMLQRALAANDGGRIRVACEPFLPSLSGVRLALLQATARDTPAELVLAQLEELRVGLPEGALCLTAYDGKPDWLRKQMKAIFGAVTATPATDGVTLFRARAPGAQQPFDRRDFSAAFAASLPGDAPLQFVTQPGVFAHRRADEGGLALAEVAARGLAPGARMLDMGCGCGLVGLLLARHAAAADVLCVDSHARAIYCTERNAAATGLAGVRTLLSDEPELKPEFTLAAGNPPYYSDYRIADLFIRTAHQALVPGGEAFIVAKSHRWHEERMRGLFGNVEIIKRRGYGVVRSVRI